MSIRLLLLAVVAVIATSCSSTPDPATDAAAPAEALTEADLAAALPTGEILVFADPPEVPEGDLSPEVQDAIETLIGSGRLPDFFTEEQNAAVETLGASGDIRLGWVMLDLFQFATFFQESGRISLISDAMEELTGFNAASRELTPHLIAWDIPAPPNYVDIKRVAYTSWEQVGLTGWDPLFDNSESVDWRHVGWGGVRIDDNAYDQTDQDCRCIPGLDNPVTQPAADAAWLEDDDVIFGVVVNGEARAYPRQIMEVREMVNDTLGGRDFAMPYCTLCGAAQVWFTDDLPGNTERPILRTSGWLIRSNKVMYDITTNSIFDTFLGDAQSGPHAVSGIELNQHTVVTSTWGDWVAEHPDTDVLIEADALGRDFDFRNNRDANGPIFPIGDVDPRLAVQEDVLGVTKADGTPIAFHVNSAITALDAGLTVSVDGISIIKDGSGIRAVDGDGNDLGAHQAFWFAWSQFNQNTELWPSAA